MYLVFLGVGLGFVFISLVAGSVLNVEGSSFFSVFKPVLISIFLIVMGGLGLLITPLIALPHADRFVLLISALGGFFVAALTNRFIILPLHRAQNTSAFFRQDTIGTTALVVESILQGGYGKIRYSVSGSVVTSPAKSDDGNQILQGTNVEIFSVEKNTFIVRSV